MRSIEARLSKVERVVAKAEMVGVEYKDLTRTEMDLLQAVRLLLEGKVRQITAPWKPGEKEQHLSGVILEIEKYIDARKVNRQV